MEIIINRSWGGASITHKLAFELGVDRYTFDRDDYRIIREVKKDSTLASGLNSKLCIVEIPDECTD